VLMRGLRECISVMRKCVQRLVRPIVSPRPHASVAPLPTTHFTSSLIWSSRQPSIAESLISQMAGSYVRRGGSGGFQAGIPVNSGNRWPAKDWDLRMTDVLSTSKIMINIKDQIAVLRSTQVKLRGLITYDELEKKTNQTIKKLSSLEDEYSTLLQAQNAAATENSKIVTELLEADRKLQVSDRWMKRRT
jgi:hypothetical protein